MDLGHSLFIFGIIVSVILVIIMIVGLFQENTHETIKYKIRDIQKGCYDITDNLQLVIGKHDFSSKILLDGKEAWTYLDGWIVYNRDIFKDFERFHYLNKKGISNNHFNTIKSYKKQLK